MNMPLLATVIALAVGGAPNASGDFPNGSFLKPYTNLWNVTVRNEKNNHIANAGTWSDEGSFITYNGHTAFRRVQVFTIKRTGGQNTTVNIMDPVTMAPLEREFSSSQGDSVSIIFNGLHVDAIDATGDNKKAPVHTNLTFNMPFYDFSGGVYGLLLAGYPLALGYSNHLTTIAEGKLTLEDIPFTVLAHETVEAGAGKHVLAWKVQAVWHEPDPKTDGSVLTFWLTKEPPYIIKLVYDSPKAGIEYTYTIA